MSQEENEGMSLMLRIAGGIVLGYLAINALGYIAAIPQWFAKIKCDRAGGFFLVVEPSATLRRATSP